MKVVLRIRWDLPWLDAEGRDRFPHRRTIEWQRERWRLFERYTLPSLQRQTHEDWEAWLLVDPANVAARGAFESGVLSGLVRANDSRVYLVDDVNSWARANVNRVGEIFLMRIDSDDMLAPRALETLLSEERLQRPTDLPLIQLRTGVAWHEPSGTLYRWVNPSPPFYGRAVSQLELRIGLPGLGHHGRVRCREIYTDDADPAFCVLLHGGNISNSKDGSWVRGVIEGERRIDIMQRFAIDSHRGEER